MTVGEWDGLSPDVLIIGCGSMGGALATRYHAWVPNGRLHLVDRNVGRVRATLPLGPRVRVVASIAELGQIRPDMTVLATKPKGIGAVLPLLASLPAANGLVVSIAAGISAASIQDALPAARIVRAMPNTPASVGAGVTGLWAGRGVTEQDRLCCEALFGAVGLVRWVGREEDIDAVTALSGSGPAYLFAVTEALAQAGADAGLGVALADELARATVIGAAAMLERSSSGPATLKAAVRSPEGTTDAALRVFEDGNALSRLFGSAVAAAHVRAKELRRSMDAVTERPAGSTAVEPAPAHSEGNPPHG